DRPLTVEFVTPGTPERTEARPLRRPLAPRLGELCSSYRFDTFHVGDANRVAATICSGLTRGNTAATPTVVWGKPGIGKTHLLHATGAEACSAGWTVACVSAEQFTNAYMAAVRSGSAEAFQHTVREVQLLLIDDIQYLEGKRGTGDELIRTMDAVAFAGGVVVAASEIHPGRLAFPDRLRSRLQAGPAIEVGCLAPGEREGFIRSVAADLRCPLPSWAVDRIAALTVSSMRMLRGAVCLAVSLAQARCLDLPRLDLELVRQADGERKLNDEEVMSAVARYFGVTEDEIGGRSRGGLVRDARAVAIAALRDRGTSLSQLGARFDGRDVSTISGLVDRGRRLLQSCPELVGELAG
ncbi:MAG: DnaA ATPase domain-containing protein, partial [Dehalococcoidia bacterium]